MFLLFDRYFYPLTDSILLSQELYLLLIFDNYNALVSFHLVILAYS